MRSQTTSASSSSTNVVPGVSSFFGSLSRNLRYWQTLAFLLCCCTSLHNVCAERDFNFNDSQVPVLEPKDEPAYKQHPYVTELSHCRPKTSEFVLVLVLKQHDWSEFNETRRAKVQDKLASFFAIPKEFIVMDSLSPSNIHTLKMGSVKRGVNNLKAINDSERLGAIRFVVGCGSSYFSMGEPIVKQIGHQIKDGSLDNITGEEFGYWLIWRKLSIRSPRRQRRQAEGSGEDDEDDYEYEDTDYSDTVTEVPTVPTHAHRHHHGVMDVKENTENDVDEAAAEVKVVVPEVEANPENNNNDNNNNNNEKVNANKLDEEIVESVSQLESVISKTIENTKHLKDLPVIDVDLVEDNEEVAELGSSNNKTPEIPLPMEETEEETPSSSFGRDDDNDEVFKTDLEQTKTYESKYDLSTSTMGTPALEVNKHHDAGASEATLLKNIEFKVDHNQANNENIAAAAAATTRTTASTTGKHHKKHHNLIMERERERNLFSEPEAAIDNENKNNHKANDNDNANDNNDGINLAEVIESQSSTSKPLVNVDLVDDVTGPISTTTRTTINTNHVAIETTTHHHHHAHQAVSPMNSFTNDEHTQESTTQISSSLSPSSSSSSASKSNSHEQEQPFSPYDASSSVPASSSSSPSASSETASVLLSPATSSSSTPSPSTSIIISTENNSNNNSSSSYSVLSGTTTTTSTSATTQPPLPPSLPKQRQHLEIDILQSTIVPNLNVDDDDDDDASLHHHLMTTFNYNKVPVATTTTTTRATTAKTIQSISSSSSNRSGISNNVSRDTSTYEATTTTATAAAAAEMSTPISIFAHDNDDFVVKGNHSTTLLMSPTTMTSSLSGSSISRSSSKEDDTLNSSSTLQPFDANEPNMNRSVSPSSVTPQDSTPSTMATTIPTTTTTPAADPSSTYPSTDYIEPRVENTPPMIKTRLQKLAITSGKAFHFVIPEDTFYDTEDLTNLRLELTEKDGHELKTNSWLHFNAEKRELYGLPLDDTVSRWQYQLTATDSSNETVTETVEISVQQHRGIRTVNHEINISVKINEKNLHNIDWQLKLTEAIAQTLGDETTGAIVVREIRQSSFDPHTATLVYFNETLPTTECPETQLNAIVKHLDASRLSDLVQPTLGIKSITGQLIGSCQKLDTTKTKSSTTHVVKNSPPITRNQIDQVNATIGHLLVYKVPADTFYDPNSNESQLKITLKTKENKELSPRHWLQFDTKNREFYGIPKGGDIGSEEYVLVAEDDGGLTATDALVVVVNHAPKRDFSAFFKAYLAVRHENFNADLQRKFIQSIAKLHGDSNTNQIQVRSITTPHDSDSTIVNFYNTSLHKVHNRCPEKELAATRNVYLINDHTLRDRVKKELGPDLNITNLSIISFGSCYQHIDNTPNEFIPTRTDEPSLKSAFPEEYLTTFILPAIIIIVMILIASLIACCLHRRRHKSGKMELGDDEERKSFRAKAPVIFQDELDEKPEIGNKSPIILKDEKPPLLPPSYNALNINGENDVDEYVPPPAVVVGGREVRGKSPATPSYRKPPPYVSP